MNKAILLGALLILYSLALNPYITPYTYDNLIYFDGARSLLENGTYKVGASTIIGWPPFFSWVLAAVFFITTPHVLVAHIVAMLFGIAALWIAYKLFEKQERSYAFACCLLAGVAPTALQAASRVMSEWPFAFLSWLFLYLLASRKGWVWVGLVLAFAIWTRVLGVVLMVAPLYEIFKGPKEYRKNCLAAIVCGLAAYAAWKGWVAYKLSMGIPVSNTYASESAFEMIHPMRFLENVGSYFLMSHLFPAIETVVVAILGVILALGIYATFKRGVLASDVYVFAMMAVLSCYEWGITRYLLPIAPFLAYYLLMGIAKRWVNLVTIFLALWLLAGDLILLTTGNGSTYGGLNLFASPSAESFYKGYWKDLYLAGHALAERAEPGGVELSPKLRGQINYIRLFSGRDVIEDGAPAAFYVQIEGEGGKGKLVGQFGEIQILKR